MLDGGTSGKVFEKGGGAREIAPCNGRQFVPAKELARALASVPSIDYQQLRADIDVVVDQDPAPRCWVD